MKKRVAADISALKAKFPEAKICTNVLSCAKGLMFAVKPKPILLVCSKQGIREAGIHMFFVFFPIKATWYDSKLKEVDRKTVRPFTGPHYPKKPAKYVLELPAKRA